MKKLFCVMVLLCASLAMQAVTHTVGRGETLASIAERYHVTVEQLVAANPGADRLFYVGLKLEIPEVEQAAETSLTSVGAQSQSPSADDAVQSSKMDAVIRTSENTNEKRAGFAAVYLLQYGFIPKVNDKDTNSAFSINAGANYYITERERGFFVGARIGWANCTFYGSAHGMIEGVSYNATSKMDSHFITLPINVGYSLATTDKKFAVTPFLALVPNFCVSSKSKYDANMSGHKESAERKNKKKTGIELAVGGQLRLWGFNLGAAYNIPLNDDQKMYFGEDGYLSVNIGFGF